MSVYRGYDQEALDAQYRLRPIWPDAPEVIAFRESESARVRERLSGRLDLAYGSGAKETLDIFPPAGGGPAPAIVYIHGGYWMGSDKSDTSYVAPGFVDEGIAFATINYTLAPEADMDRIVADCRRAVAWIWKNAKELGVDRDRLFVAGHSAGGHLTAMMLATDWKSVDPALPAAPFRGACALSGLHDLEPVRLTFMNETLGLTPEMVARNSPLYLDPAMDVPLLLSVGEFETDEFKRHQSELFAAWTAKGLAIEEVSAPGCHHYTIIGHFGDPETQLHRVMRAMIEGV